MLPLYLTVFFLFAVSHRGSISEDRLVKYSGEKHGVAEAEEAVSVFDGNLVGVQYMLPSGQRRDKHDERALREMEVRDEGVDAAEANPYFIEKGGLPIRGKNGVPSLAKVFSAMDNHDHYDEPEQLSLVI